MNTQDISININSGSTSSTNVKSLKELSDIISNGIDFAVSGEDIAKDENNSLIFADKEYSPEDYSGLGRVYLRKNLVNATFDELLPFNGFVDGVEVQAFSPAMVPSFVYFDTAAKRFVATQLVVFGEPKYYNSWNDSASIEPRAGKYMNPDARTGFSYDGKLYRYSSQDGLVESEGTMNNVLTQEMLSSANTIYHIQYDYDLNGAEITIPDNCVLKFEGGSIKNGTVIFNNTKVDANYKVFEDIKFKDAYATEMSVIWFGAKSDNAIHTSGKMAVVKEEGMDVSIIINKMLASNIYNIFIPAGIYYWTQEVFCRENLRLRGNFVRGYMYEGAVGDDHIKPRFSNQCIIFDNRLAGKALITMGYYDYDTDTLYRKAIHMSGLNMKGVYDIDNDVTILSGWIGWSEIYENIITWVGYFFNSFSEDYKNKTWAERNGVEYDPSVHKPNSGIWKTTRIHNNRIVVFKTMFDCHVVDSYIYNNSMSGNPTDRGYTTYFFNGYNYHYFSNVFVSNNYLDYFTIVYNASSTFRLYSTLNNYEITTAVLTSRIEHNNPTGIIEASPEIFSSVNDQFSWINNNLEGNDATIHHLLYRDDIKQPDGDTGYYTIDSTIAVLKCIPKQLNMVIGGLTNVDYIFQGYNYKIHEGVQTVNIIGGNASNFHFNQLLNQGNATINISALDNLSVDTIPTNNLYVGRKVMYNNSQCVFNGTKWKDANGYTVGPKFGATVDRPVNLDNSDLGYSFYNTDSSSAEIYKGNGEWEKVGSSEQLVLRGISVVKGALHDKLIAIQLNSIKNHKVYTLHTTIADGFYAERDENGGLSWIRIYHGMSNPDLYGWGNGILEFYSDHINLGSYTNDYNTYQRVFLENPLVKGPLDVTLTVNGDSTKSSVVIENGGIKQQYEVDFRACNGEIFAWEAPGATTGESTFSFNCTKYNADTWLFGDSYVTSNASDKARWTSYLLADGHDDFLLNGYSGENSQKALVDLKTILEHGNPKRLVWCLGMNDRDSSSSVNQSWKDVYDELVNICEKRGIELIMATIPTVSGVNDLRIHKYKNAIIKSSGLRYIDFAAAVGANETTGKWTSGYLYTDGVHPTEEGAFALYKQAIADVPELLGKSTGTTVSYGDIEDTPDVYTKDEIDDKLKGYFNKEDLVPVDKSELEALANTKANLADTYSKADVDSLLDDKSDKSDTYTKKDLDDIFAEFVRRPDLDDALGRITDNENAIEKEASEMASKLQDIKNTAVTKDELDNEVDNLKDTLESKADITDKLKNYYDKTEIFTSDEVLALTNTKANLADVYTKTETYSKYQADNLLSEKADAVNVFTKTQTQDLLAGKANTTSVYLKDEVYSRELALNEFCTKVEYANGNVYNKTIPSQNITGVRTSSGWKTVVFANDSNLVWENTNGSDVHCYIELDKNTKFGSGDIQVCPLVNGEQVTSGLSVTLWKFKDGSLSDTMKTVGFGIFYKSIAKNVTSFFNSTYSDWLNYTNYDRIIVDITNDDVNNPAFTAGDRIDLVVKTNGTTTTSGYGFELSINDMATRAVTGSLSFELNSGGDFKIGVRNESTGEIDYLSTGIKNSGWTMTDAEYNWFKSQTTSGNKTVVVVPVYADGDVVNTSDKLTVSNIIK